MSYWRILSIVMTCLCVNILILFVAASLSSFITLYTQMKQASCAIILTVL